MICRNHFLSELVYHVSVCQRGEYAFYILQNTFTGRQHLSMFVDYRDLSGEFLVLKLGDFHSILFAFDYTTLTVIALIWVIWATRQNSSIILTDKLGHFSPSGISI